MSACPNCGRDPCVNPSFCALTADNRPSGASEERLAALAALPPLAYYAQRKEAAQALGITVGALDKLVRSAKTQAVQAEAALPHWQVEPSPEPVDCAALLADIEQVFTRYIVLPRGASVALALWVLHAWTIDAGDISPFLVLVSPTKRCGKTNTLIILLYLTPRSELASNISASALFRYIEKTRPTLLIDEADSFAKENEELRGILNAGHTKTAAYVIRNVEVNGDHEPRRFSTWAPKAIASIQSLADTLEDRAVVLTLQRKPPGAKVERLRKRDNGVFAGLRRQARRWAEDTLSALADPEPKIPDALNDRAADNWRPLLAIADLAGGAWPRRAREAACILSGGEHESSSHNVDLLGDIWSAFGDADALRSADLVARLTADPEKPWAEWKHGKPLTQKQLAGLLRPFGIISETVSIHGLADAKGYRRVRFEEAWDAYLPPQNPGQNASPPSSPTSETSKRRNADGSRGSSDFRSVAESPGDGSKNSNLSYSHAGFDASTDRKSESGVPCHSDQENGTPRLPRRIIVRHVGRGERLLDDLPRSLRRCSQCNAPGDARGALFPHGSNGSQVWLHSVCVRFWETRQGH